MKEKLKKIKLLALDVDGVLTDGRIIYDSAGRETKNFDVHDGMGLVLFKHAGLKTAIISARASKVVQLRARDLNVDKVYLDAYPKLAAYKRMLKHFKLKDHQVCFVGDDLPDIVVLKRVGFSVSVPNGHGEVKKRVHYITKKRGGRGAVREVIELILKAQGRWKGILKNFVEV